MDHHPNIDIKQLEIQLDMIIDTYCDKNKHMLLEFGRKYGFLDISRRYQAYSRLFCIDEEEVIEFTEKCHDIGI